MKPLALVFIIGLHLSCLTYVYSIKCFTCDPEVEDNCKNAPINCAEDETLGHAFDSCYINQILAEDKNGTIYKHVTKNCGIKDGCKEMRDIMCDTINKTHDYLVRVECYVHCCDEQDYCNAEHHTRTASPDVQGLKSSAQIQISSGILVMFSYWLLRVLL